ncbi:unnamed protein product [Ectocarpus sp. 8 AP-2014]
MSSAREGTALILASVAVFLLVYVMKQECQGPRRHGNAASGVVGAIKSALGARRAADCSKVNPGHADWARCAQGSAMGRVPTKNAAAVVKNSSLDFASDSLRHQGLGMGRLQDDFVHDQYSSSLGAPRPGGMRIDKSSLKNNGFFSGGTRNASSLVTATGISSEGAAAFPFSSKSGDKREEYAKTTASGRVPGTEPVGMGMKLSRLKRKVMASVNGGGRRSASRAQVNKKLGVAPFEADGAALNPFAGKSAASLGKGIKITDAFDAQKLGMGSGLKEAYGSLGAAVSPFSSSDVGVSPDEIAAATAALEEVNIVQSTCGGNIDRFIRP